MVLSETLGKSRLSVKSGTCAQQLHIFTSFRSVCTQSVHFHVRVTYCIDYEKYIYCVVIYKASIRPDNTHIRPVSAQITHT